MILFIMVIATAALAYVAGAAAFGHFKSGSRELKQKVHTLSGQLRLARGTLQLIARDMSGQPSLDASLTLEDIDNYEIKELS